MEIDWIPIVALLCLIILISLIVEVFNIALPDRSPPGRGKGAQKRGKSSRRSSIKTRNRLKGSKS